MFNIKKSVARPFAAAVAAVLLLTFLPLAPVAEAIDELSTEYSFDDGSFALYAGNGGLLLNEKKVTVNGSVFSDGKFNYTGAQDALSVSGKLLKGSDGAKCEIPDYIGAVNNQADYDFTFDGDKDITSSEIDLSAGSFSCEGSVDIEHSQLKGKGNITAKKDINMELYGDKSDSQQAIVMSENGNISVNAANLSFNGVLYAPNGKVEINAKNIDFVGGIYAKQIEINGTSLNLKYKNLLPEILFCKAAKEDVVRIGMNEELVLTGYCNHDDAEVKYSADSEQAEFVTIKNSDTLKPTLTFSETGEYEITLTATRNGEKATDTVKVIVTFGAVVNYTSTEDFESGELSGLSGADDELKLESKNSDAQKVVKDYSLNAEKGISVKSEQNKSELVSSNDSLEIGYNLTGYGKTQTGNGSDVILVIDNSGSVSSMSSTIKETAVQIIDSMGPNDRFGITSLDNVNTVLTDSKKALKDSINKYSLSGGSNFGNGLKVAMSMFDEKSENRNKYIILLADGENSSSDDEVALNAAKLAAEQGVKIYSFEINPFSTNFSDTKIMQQVAIDTKGAYKLCPDANAISTFMLKMADSIYNIAARNVTFTTTVMNADWLNTQSFSKAPDSVVKNDDGSVTVSWNYNTFDIGHSDDIKINLTADMLNNSGYELITTNNKLISYDDKGVGSVIYLDDVIVGKNNYNRNGKWSSSVFDSKKNGCIWSLVKWNADYKGNSVIDVYLSTSNDGVNFGSPVKVTNGQKLNINGRYIKTEVEMKASEDGATPTLYDLTIYTSDEVQAAKPEQGNSIKICGAKTVNAESPLFLWLDIDGTYDNVSDIEWKISNWENASYEKIGQLQRKLTFAKEGEYSVTVEVTAGGIKSKASVNITVLPKEKLQMSIGGGTEFKPVKMTVSETPEYLTSTSEPVKFNITFDDPEQVSWVRVMYSNQKAWGTNVFQAFVDEADGNNVSITLPGTNSAETVITVQAFDWYGNMTEEVRKVIMDRTPPTISLRSDKTSFYPGNSAVITATATDNWEIAKAVFKCGDEELALDEIGQYVFTPTESGSYTFTYTVTDKAGLESSRSLTINVRQDTTQPSISISGTSRVVLGNSVNLKIYASDRETGLASWKLKLNDSTELLSFNSENEDVPAEYEYKFTPEETGRYVFTAEAVDKAGNTRTYNYTVNCVADNQAPNIRMDLSKSEVNVGEEVTVTVTATDEVAVSELHFFVDGTEQTLSEDGTFTYIADDTGFNGNTSKYVEFKATAKDNSLNERTVTKKLKVKATDDLPPEIVITVPEKLEYNSQNAYMQVVVTDNIGVASTEVYVNGNKVSLDANRRYYFDTSELCEYSIVVKATDTSGNTSEKTAKVAVKDTQAPTVTLSSDKTTYDAGETPVINCIVKDNVGVTKVEADLNGTVVKYDFETGKLIMPETYAPGDYVLSVTAYDESGNASDKATCSFTVLNPPIVENPNIDEVTYTPQKLITGVQSKIMVKTSGGSGNIKVTLKVGNETLKYDNASKSWLYTPNKTGEIKLIVRAEDELGNYAEKTVLLTVYANPEGHKLKVDAPKVVAPQENFSIKLSSTDGVPFDEVELWLGSQQIKLTNKNNDGSYAVSLYLSGTGEAAFKAIGKNADGSQDTVEFTIQISSDYQTEIKSEEMQNALKQTSETTLNDELKALAAKFNSPADAYEYVYNNVAFECYVHSRRGAVGAYELGRGNDFDQASLLIGLLREMGYPARYAKGTIKLTSDQVKSLMAMEDLDSATGMIASSGKTASYLKDESGNKSVKLDEVYVQVYVPYSALGETDESKKNLGVWVKLDTSIKDSKLVDYETKDYSSIEGGYPQTYIKCYDKYKGKGYDSILDKITKTANSDNVISERQIIKKKFNVLPSTLQYGIVSPEKVTTFNEIPVSMTDRIAFSVQGVEDPQSLGTYKISELYGKRVTIQYVGNTEGKTVFEMSPSALRNNDFVPALTVDGKIIYKASSDSGYGLDEYYGTWHIGKKNTLYTTIFTGGKQQETIEDKLVVGSMYSFTIDTGGISNQDMQKTMDTAIAANPTDQNDPNFPTASNYYDEDKVGTYLDYAGKFYASECYLSNLVNAADKNIEVCSNTKVIIMSYQLNVAETSIGGWNTGVSRVDDGYFQTDVAYNSMYSFSRTGNVQDRNDYMFSSSYSESFFEGWIWEVMLLHHAVSTASLLDTAIQNGDKIIMLDKSNFSTMIGSVSGLTNDELKEITEAVNNGYVVMVPEKRITINDWTGTGYIIADLKDYNNFVFRVSGGLNGGSTVSATDLNNSIDADECAKNMFQDFTEEFLNATNANLDDLVPTYFSICNSLYYLALVQTTRQVGTSAMACVKACNAGGFGALFAVGTGMTLINDVQSMADVVNNKITLYDTLYKYCMDEISSAEALKEFAGIMFDFLEAGLDVSLNDGRDALLGEDFADFATALEFKSNIEAIVNSWSEILN